MAKLTKSKKSKSESEKPSTNKVSITIGVSEEAKDAMEQLLSFLAEKTAKGRSIVLEAYDEDDDDDSEELELFLDGEEDKIYFKSSTVAPSESLKESKSNAVKVGTCSQCNYVGKPMGKVCPECGTVMVKG